jgi:hypothetical protein
MVGTGVSVGMGVVVCSGDADGSEGMVCERLLVCVYIYVGGLSVGVSDIMGKGVEDTTTVAGVMVKNSKSRGSMVARVLPEHAEICIESRITNKNLFLIKVIFLQPFRSI